MNEDAQDSPQTYASYLHTEELLALQHPRSAGPEHDELLFIVIHQVYELWFKQLLHELDHAIARLGEGDTERVAHTLARVLRILKVGVAQLDVLETMTPLQFQSFRARLDSASGFQSAQFRELEFVLGHKRARMVAHFPPGSAERERLAARLARPSLWHAFVAYLAEAGFDVPVTTLARDASAPTATCEGVQAALLLVYRQHSRLAALCERLVDLDEGMQEWRYRHVKMVERTIGDKSGTGGSSGVEYLRRTLFEPLFPDLWQIRSQL